MIKIMRKILFLFLVLSPFTIFGQTISGATFVPVENMPAHLIPKKVKEIGFLFSDTSDYSAFGYPLPKGKFKILSKTETDLAGVYGMADLNVSYINDTVVVSTRVPFKAAVFLYYYTWNGKKLKYEKTESFDPSWDEIELAQEALKNENIWGAVDHYNAVQYPASYLDEAATGIEIMSLANQLCLRNSKLKNYAEASDYLEASLQYYFFYFILEEVDEKVYLQTLEDYGISSYQDSIGKWLGNLGYCLYKAGSLDRSIDVNYHSTKIYPKLSGPYLQLGDAWFDQGNPEYAKAPYLKYIAIMKESNKEGSIPERVHERVK